jgi:hypothetical protein
MRFCFLLLLLSVTIFAKEKDSFITEQEYAEHLYENPRGIGCDKCHGKRGEGSVIARYKDKGETKELKTDEINSIGFEAFKLALQERHGVMPKYFLTSQEIKALYSYLHKEK